MKYREIPNIDEYEIESIIAQDDTERLQIAVLSAALHSDDQTWAEDICLRLAHHPDAGVRGNAILGLGHIARLHGRLDMKTVRPIIAAALHDSEEYVRGQADSAADDISIFLGAQVRD